MDFATSLVLEAQKASKLDNLKLKVWWIPQVPMEAFEVEVETINEGRKLCDVLANYDAFQFENRIKPDYCNMGGLSCSHPQIEGGGWFDVPEDDDELVHWIEEIAEANKRPPLPAEET